MEKTTKLSAIGLVIILILLGFVASCLAIADVAVATPIRVACIGDSITERSGYTIKLRSMLGSNYSVENFGVSGSTISLDSKLPYMNQVKFLQAKTFDPDVVIIMLGTNDANPEISPNEDNIESDYSTLINAFQQLDGRQLIWLVKSPPIFASNSNYNNTYLSSVVIPHIDSLAERMNLPIIDIYNVLSTYPDYFADGVHPTNDGAAIIASHIYDAITLSDGSIDRSDFGDGYLG